MRFPRIRSLCSDDTVRLARYSLVATIIVLLINSLACLVFYLEKQRYQERATSAAQNIVRLLDQQISDTFGKIDVILQSNALFYQNQQRSGRLDARQVNDFLAHNEALLPYLDALRILDAQGIVRFGSGQGTNLNDREMFIRAHQGQRNLIIYGPIFGRLSQKWVITVARRLETPDGAFAGVIFASLDTRSFEKVLSLASVGSHGAATIRALDLALVHRYPSTMNSVGSREVSTQLKEIIVRHPAGGEYIAPTSLDGIERSNAFRRLDSAPFYVLVGLATRDYMGAWRAKVWLISSLAALASLITLLASWFVYQANHALRIDIANRIRISRKLEQAMTERADLYAELEIRARELEEMNASLESMVADRTAKLTRANHELAQIARSDPLTGLGNRLFADERLLEEFLHMKNSGIMFSVLLIDIDFFKRVNDAHGHEAGDSVLKEVAHIMTQAVRTSDFLARFGGEEFLVVLPATTLDHALIVAEKIRAAVAATTLPGMDHITLSIGAALASIDNSNKEDVVRHADQALYEAKAQGRNRVCAWSAPGQQEDTTMQR